MKKISILESLNVMLGSDPEIFVADVNDTIVSGIDLIPGDKENPHPISGDGHFIQVDNIAWEFNIPPCKTAESFSENIQFVLDDLTIKATEHGLVLSKKSSEVIENKYLKDPRALVFGCEPDYNAYTCSHNPTPNNKTKLRCVGGHVHIGYANPSVKDTIRIVKMFDLMVVLNASLLDPDKRRRELYGKPGAFRFKDFGVECRALSNFWIHTDELRTWVFNQTTDAIIIALKHSKLADEIIAKYENSISDIIMSNDNELIEKTIEEINSLVADVLKEELLTV